VFPTYLPILNWFIIDHNRKTKEGKSELPNFWYSPVCNALP
jgi:hypothetical protein